MKCFSLPSFSGVCVRGCACVCISLLELLTGLLLLLSRFMVWLTECAGWQEHNRESLDAAQHFDAFEITPSPSTHKKKIDNKIYFFFFLLYVECKDYELVGKKELYRNASVRCLVRLVKVNVVLEDAFDWRIFTGFGINSVTKHLLLHGTPSSPRPHCDRYLDLSPRCW